ncbi:hypothetical protein, partial [Sporolactobacillus spathodeae]|uniref:hypothetical protein n=1 Tax=Sporolactobacillus spathodeae TaxID=1465502 RepID=UPI001961BDF6
GRPPSQKNAFLIPQTAPHQLPFLHNYTGSTKFGATFLDLGATFSKFGATFARFGATLEIRCNFP